MGQLGEPSSGWLDPISITGDCWPTDIITGFPERPTEPNTTIVASIHASVSGSLPTYTMYTKVILLEQLQSSCYTPT